MPPFPLGAGARRARREYAGRLVLVTLTVPPVCMLETHTLLASVFMAEER